MFSRVLCRVQTIFKTFKISLFAAALLAPLEAWAQVPLVELEGDLPAELRETLTEVLGEVDKSPRSLAQARRRAERAAELAESVLRSEGYYGAELDVRLTVPDGDQNLTPVLLVIPNDRFSFGEITINYQPRDPGLDIIDRLPVKTGRPARAADVIAAEQIIIRELRQTGYPAYEILPRDAIVDHDTGTMTLTFNVSTGPLTRYGEVRFDTDTQATKGFLRLIQTFEQGDIYDHRELNDMRANAVGSGAFKDVVVELEDRDRDSQGAEVTRDVVVRLNDRPKNTVRGSLGISTGDGSGLELEYERRNVHRYAQFFRIDSILKTNNIGFDATYYIPYARSLDRSLEFGAGVGREDTEAFEGYLFRTHALLTQDIGEYLQLGFGVAAEASRFDESLDEVDAYVIKGRLTAAYDRSNDLLNPTDGYRLNARIFPAQNFGDNSGFYTRLEAGGTIYQTVSDNLVIAARAGGGTLVGDGQATVPLNDRFFGGGGGSVRGYAYQSISPEDAIGDLIGGRSLLEGSLEARYRTDGRLGYVAFIDVASVGTEDFSGFEETYAGLGVGVRYYTSFAPLRADIAVPLNKRDGDEPVQIYLSIGQAF